MAVTPRNESAQEPTAPPPAATPLAIPQLPPEVLQGIVTAVLAAVSVGSKPTAEQSATLDALKLAINTQAQYAEEFKRQVRKSNRYPTNVSAFTFDPHCDFCKDGAKHPDITKETSRGPVVVEEGGVAHPKPKLKHDVFFCNNRVWDNDITIEEVGLYNQFDHDVEAHDGDWWAKFKKNGTRRELHVMVPYRTHDEKASLPSSLTAVLAELLYGNRVIDPATVIATQREMQRQIDELRTMLAAATQKAPA